VRDVNGFETAAESDKISICHDEPLRAGNTEFTEQYKKAAPIRM